MYIYLTMQSNCFKTTLVAFLLVFSFSANAQTEELAKTKYSLEIDPATFGFNGYGVHLRIQPKTCEHLLFGAGIYTMDFPDLFVGFNPKNKDKGWEVRLNQGAGIFAEHHFSEVNRKWFVGAQSSLQQYKIEKAETAGSEQFTNGLLMAYGGYTFKPFGEHFYIKPWAGVGASFKLDGENTIGGQEYDIAPVTMFSTLHLGYTF